MIFVIRRVKMNELTNGRINHSAMLIDGDFYKESDFDMEFSLEFSKEEEIRIQNYLNNL